MSRGKKVCVNEKYKLANGMMEWEMEEGLFKIPSEFNCHYWFYAYTWYNTWGFNQCSDFHSHSWCPTPRQFNLSGNNSIIFKYVCWMIQPDPTGSIVPDTIFHLIFNHDWIKISLQQKNIIVYGGWGLRWRFLMNEILLVWSKRNRHWKIVSRT